MSKKENKPIATETETQEAGPANVPGTSGVEPNVAAPSSQNSSDAGASDLAPAQLEELKTKAAKADEYWDRLLRSAAEFDNFKKRAARERQDAIKYANESLLEKLVPVLDNFDMAISAANNPQGNTVESIRTGISMIYGQLKTLMLDAGLEEIDAANKPFDANWHEAVSQQESSDVPEGQVLQQLRKGYKLRDRLVRPATVVVAKKPSA